MKILIKQVKEKKFQGDDGTEISYFWYVGKRNDTGMITRFGSVDGSHEVGKEYDLELESDISSQGKSILKEFVLQEE